MLRKVYSLSTSFIVMSVLNSYKNIEEVATTKPVAEKIKANLEAQGRLDYVYILELFPVKEVK